MPHKLVAMLLLEGAWSPEAVIASHAFVLEAGEA